MNFYIYPNGDRFACTFSGSESILFDSFESFSIEILPVRARNFQLARQTCGIHDHIHNHNCFDGFFGLLRGFRKVGEWH